MSTVLVFNPVADLAVQQTGSDEVTLSWTAATRILTRTNLDAEANVTSGLAVGWTAVEGTLNVRVNQPGREPPQGLNIFDGGTSGTSRAKQRFSPLGYGLTIAQIDDGGDPKTMTVDWWGGTFTQTPNDQPKLLIHFYDADMVLISTHDSGFKDPTTAIGVMKWNEYQETPVIPSGTRFTEIEMWANRRNGSNNDAAFDDIRISYEDQHALPYVPGYAIYQNGVLIATAPANADEYVVSGLAAGDYAFEVAPYDGTNFLGAVSNEADITLADPNPTEDSLNPIIAFDDEEIYGGYLGGKLRGKVVACPGRNASIAKTCC